MPAWGRGLTGGRAVRQRWWCARGHEASIGWCTCRGAFPAMQFARRRAALATLVVGGSGDGDGPLAAWVKGGGGVHFTSPADYVANLDEDQGA